MRAPRAIVLVAGFVSLVGAWLLASGGALAPPNLGDALVLIADFAWATGIALTPIFLARSGRPLLLAFVQYTVCAGLAALCSALFESMASGALVATMPTILFAGIVSGALAYTIQIFAQAHTPPAEAALILALEGVFAALAGALLLGERLTAIGASRVRADSGRRGGGGDWAVVRARARRFRERKPYRDESEKSSPSPRRGGSLSQPRASACRVRRRSRRRAG